MPMYHARCSKCGTSQDYFSRIDNRHVTPVCCDGPMLKVLEAAMVGAMNWTGWKGVRMPDANGTFIEDGAAYKRYLKQHNVIPESEGKSEAAHQQKQQAANDDRKLTQAVEKAVYTHVAA